MISSNITDSRQGAQACRRAESDDADSRLDDLVSETPCTKRSDIMTSIETLLRIKGWLINTSPLEPPCLRGTGERCFRSTTAPSKAFGHGPVMPIAGYPQGCTSAWAATITISIMERMRYLAQILTAEIVLFSHVGVDALLFVFVAVSCSYNKKPSRSYKNSPCNPIR